MLKIKATFLSLLFSFCGIFLYAKADVSFSFGINTKIGEHREKVFKNGALISLLEWQLLPVVNFEFGMDVYSKFIHFSHISSIGMPQIAGSMKDSDYIGKNSIQILFSKHRSYLKEHVEFFESLGFPFRCAPKNENSSYSFFLEPIIGFYFSHIKWHAKNGYTQYEGEDDSYIWQPSWPKKEYSGGGVEYVKQSFLPFFALNAKFIIVKKWEFSLNNLFSPFLIVHAKDTHFDTKKIYLDIFYLPGFVFKTYAMLEYKIKPRIALYGSLGFILLRNNNGKTTLVDMQKKEILASFAMGSAKISAIEANISVGIRFCFTH